MSMIFVYNISSLRCHHDHLSLLINQHKPAVIALTETLLNDNDPLSFFNMENYENIIVKNLIGRSGGGVASYVCSNFLKFYETIISNTIDENIILKVTKKKLGKHTRYR